MEIDRAKRVEFTGSSWGRKPDTSDLLRAAADYLDDHDGASGVDIVLDNTPRGGARLVMYYLPGPDEDDDED